MANYFANNELTLSQAIVNAEINPGKDTITLTNDIFTPYEEFKPLVCPLPRI